MLAVNSAALAECIAGAGEIANGFRRIEPSRRLGTLRDAVRRRAGNIERWIAQGEEDSEMQREFDYNVGLCRTIESSA